MGEQRLLINETRKEVDLYGIFGHGCGFEEAIKRLEDLRDETYWKIKEDRVIRFDIEHAGYDGGWDVWIMVDRWETDEEYQKRRDRELKYEREQAERKALRKAKADERARKQLLQSEAEERALYEQLKQKFES